MFAYRRHSGFVSAVVSCVLAVSIMPLGAAPAAAEAPADSGAHDHALHDHGHAQAELLTAAAGACPGHAQEVGDTGMCSHGPDPIPDYIDDRGGPTRFSSLTPTPNQTTAVGCDGDGTSGKRIQALYVYVAGRTNRRDAWLNSFRFWASNVDAMFRESAQETGGTRRVRWVTNASCLLAVQTVAVSPAAEAGFGAMMSELAALGYNRNDRKYLVWFDSDRTKSPICGVSTVWNDDRPTDNLNNERTGYARVDKICWDFAEQHEVMHVLGAVQTSAPNATPGLHCTDEYDQMCYSDGAGVVLRYVCPARYERLFDCNHDDYFSTSPAPGSYLATHWNTAYSGWLVGAVLPPAPPAPPANDAFAAAALLSGSSGSVTGTSVSATAEPGEAAATPASPPIASAWYAWTAPDDGILLVHTCGSALDTTLGAWTGSAVGALTLVAFNDDDPNGTCGADSRLQLDVYGGTAYWLSVDGRGAAEGSFTLAYQLVPAGADLVAPVVHPPGPTIGAPQTLASKVSVEVSWPEALDPSGIVAYQLQRRRGNRAWLDVALPSPTATTVTTLAVVDASHSYRIRATDGAGNPSAWITTSTGKLALLQEGAPAIRYTGAFKRRSVAGASGGYVRSASAAGRIAVLTFTGRSVGFVTTLGPNRGIAELRIDGGDWLQIDLYAPSVATRRITWAEAPNSGAHTLEVRVTGTRNSASSGSRVDIDAFLSWH